MLPFLIITNESHVDSYRNKCCFGKVLGRTWMFFFHKRIVWINYAKFISIKMLGDFVFFLSVQFVQLLKAEYLFWKAWRRLSGMSCQCWTICWRTGKCSLKMVVFSCLQIVMTNFCRYRNAIWIFLFFFPCLLGSAGILWRREYLGVKRGKFHQCFSIFFLCCLCMKKSSPCLPCMFLKCESHNVTATKMSLWKET